MESDKHVPITGLPDMVGGAKPDRELFVLIYCVVRAFTNSDDHTCGDK